MRAIMFLTLSSSILSRLVGAVLVGLLGSGSVVADASDWLPLAVGNSWTYSHEYYDYENRDGYTRWTNYTTPQFTLSVLGTEDIDGQTYFVISDMPEFWPPVPSQFIAGKKLRWEGDHLLERTADGEQALFRFDGGGDLSKYAYYDVVIEGQTIQVTAWETRANSRHEYSFRFSGGAGPVRVYDADAVDYYDLDAGRELDEVRVELKAGISFLKGFGIRACGVGINDGDAPLFSNGQKAQHAVLNGRTVTVREARKASVTTIEGDSWGGIKQEERE